MSDTYRVQESELTRFCREVFAACDLSPEHAAALADTLVQGELHGLGSHGVSRLLPTYVQRLQRGGINPRPRMRVLSRRGTTGVVDGDDGPGAVVGHYAMDLVLEMAREHGSGWVAARNSTHFGAAFLYARRAVAEGMIGYCTTAAIPIVLPYGGRAPALGTNPICFAIPGGERGDLILDMATSVVARGKIQLAVLERKDIPLGWAVDHDGNPTTSAVEGAKGYLLPMGAYKGYGLAAIVEVFSSVLSGAAVAAEIGAMFSDMDKPQGMGHFFGALDVSGFLPIDEFRERMDRLIEYIKSTPRAEGVEEILVAGEPEARKAALYRVEGIPLAEDVVSAIQQVAADLGVEPLQVICETGPEGMPEL
ncbi:MAG: Ldh family oxidoreductase [Chloroflexi bacterium]|nr:Ldh family oxidoreductase [Chloroflexota bacterium]